MRMGTYSRSPERRWRAAVFTSGSQLLDLALALDCLAKIGERPQLPAALSDTADILNWVTPAGISLARKLAERAASAEMSEALISRTGVTLGPPVPTPGKFIAIGRNYMKHVREGQKLWAARGVKVEVPAFPAAFVKFSSSIVGHGMPIVIPQGVENVDYELELALVIGRPAHCVSVESALDYVAGYTICNDVGARNIQRLEMEQQIGITLSKNFPSFAPIGPWMVTADEIPDPQQLEISLDVNGEQRQAAHTSDMIFSIAQIVSYWPQVGLEPGDMITTGTPSGVALARPEPARYYLKDGDVVKLTIERIGELENAVVQAR